MEERFQFGHVLEQKPAVLVNRVAAQRRRVLGNIAGHKLKQLFLSHGLGHDTGLDLLDQATAAMGAFVPCVHRIQHAVGLVNHQHRPFDARRQVGPGHDHGKFQQKLFGRVQSTHFAVQPDQVQIAFGQ